MPDRVLILGATARAAAASARRAGLTPFAVDLFADRDTRVLCEHVEKCPLGEYPRGLFERARRLPPMPWLYTGGLENHPDLVGELAAERELWGNGPDVLRRVRDPFALARWAADLGLTFPRCVAGGERVPGWRMLRKPYRSAAGVGVSFANSAGADAHHYLQAFVPGEPMSVVFEGGDEEPSVGHQLVGVRWLHTGKFTYCGNLTLGSERVDRSLRYRADHLALLVSRHFRLTGVVGIDFINTSTTLVPVEVNPRYPASAEVHELRSGYPILFTRASDSAQTGTAGVGGVVGKAIYYAARRLTVPASGPWDESLRQCSDVWRRPDFADIPHPGDVIGSGQPVVTLLADAATGAECLATLKARAAELDRLFGVPTPGDDSP